MLVLDEKGLSGIVKKLLDIIFGGGILITLSLPLSLKWYLDSLGARTNEKYYFMLPFLYITGILALAIVHQIRQIFRSLNRRNPFMVDNVISLKRIALASFIISLAYIVKTIFFNSILTVIIAMVFIIAGLFSIILAEVFWQAIVVKEENDLTI